MFLFLIALVLIVAAAIGWTKWMDKRAEEIRQATRRDAERARARRTGW